MTQLLVFAGAIVGIFALILAAQVAARKRGIAEQQAADQAAARKAEQEMTDISMQPTSPADTKDALNKGEF